MGSVSSVVVTPGGKVTVPIIIDLANAGPAGIANLEAGVSWGAARLIFDSIRVVPALGWSFASTLEGVPEGKVGFGASSTSVLSATATLANLYFTASTVPGGTRLRALPTWATDADGQGVNELMRTRALDVCIAKNGRWGDVNDDESVNIIDAQQIARFGVGLAVSNSTAMLERGDVTANTSVDVIDAQQIARFSVGFSAAPRISVSQFVAPVPASIALQPATAQNMAQFVTLDLAATPLAASGADITGCTGVTWSSSNTSVAIVSSDGVVTSQSGGSATITARSAANTAIVASVSIVVEPDPPPSLILSADTLRFTAWKEGANPPLQRVVIGLTGNGVVEEPTVGEIAYGAGSGWLQATMGVYQGQRVLLVQPLTAGIGANAVIGTVQLRAKGAENSPQLITVLFDIRIAPRATTLDVASGNDQSIEVGSEVVTLPEVLVRDQYGSPMTGASVTFATPSDGGVVHDGTGAAGPQIVVTNANGLARLPGWRVAKIAQPQQVLATLTGAPSIAATIASVAAPGVPVSLLKSAGDNQTMAANSLGLAPQVLLLDKYGNPTPGVTVAFSTIDASVVTGAIQVTGPAGTAAVDSWNAGPIVSTVRLRATVTGLPFVVFEGSVVAATPASMTKSAGDAQTQTVFVPTTTRPKVRVSDAFGNWTAGIPVRFFVAGGGTVVGGETVTDANGQASPAEWRMSQSAGPQTLYATSPGLPTIRFTATATAGAPAQVVRWSSGGYGYATAGTLLSVAPTVRVFDEYSNPVANVAVTFTATAGGVPGNAAVVTNGSGLASTSWKLGPGPGANDLVASVPGATSTPFSATAILTIERVSGNFQKAATGTMVYSPPTVVVRGAYGVPVEGAVVTWRVEKGGGSWGYQNFRSFTYADGIALVNWTLGPGLDEQVLSASLEGVDPVLFSATSGSPCVEANFQSLALGTQSQTVQLSGSLGAADCHGSIGILSGVIDGYKIAVPFTSLVSLHFSASGIATPLVDLRSSRDLVLPAASGTSLRAILPGGTYYYRGGGLGSNATGSYTISTSVASSTNIGGCYDPPFVVPGLITEQQLDDVFDCTIYGRLFGPDRRMDEFRIYLNAGKTYEFRQQSSVFDTWIRLLDGTRTAVAQSDDADGGTNSRMSFTPESTGIYVIQATSSYGGKTGAYTLSISAP